MATPVLTPIRSLELSSRPDHYTVSDDGTRLAVCSTGGQCRIFDSELHQIEDLSLGEGVSSIQLNEDGSILLAIFGDRIDGYSMACASTRAFQLPIGPDGFASCAFLSGEGALCVATSERVPRLTAWDLTTFELVAEAALRDVGGGHMLGAHPEGQIIAVIAYSGQSEDWTYWAHYARGTLRVFETPELEDVAYPRFHPNGGEFVSFPERLGLARMRFPSGELIGSVTPEEAFADGNGFGYDFHYLSDGRLLAWQIDLALHAIDLETMQSTGTVLTGIDGRRFGEDRFYAGQSWQLAGQRLLTSDRQYDSKLENAVLTFRLWSLPELFPKPVDPRPSRPWTAELLAREW